MCSRHIIAAFKAVAGRAACVTKTHTQCLLLLLLLLLPLLLLAVMLLLLPLLLLIVKFVACASCHQLPLQLLCKLQG
jgi:hypothetical protein